MSRSTLSAIGNLRNHSDQRFSHGDVGTLKAVQTPTEVGRQGWEVSPGITGKVLTMVPATWAALLK